jgi:hypothetical protein
MGPIPGFAFRGRKAFRLRVTPVGGCGKLLAHGESRGPGTGMAAAVPRETNLSPRIVDAQGTSALLER